MVDHVAGFLELPMFANASLRNIYYLIKLAWDKFVKKKRTFHRNVVCKSQMQIFLGIAMFSWFFSIINVYQFFFKYIVWQSRLSWNGGWKKTFRYYLHPYFLKAVLYFFFGKILMCILFRIKILYFLTIF